MVSPSETLALNIQIPFNLFTEFNDIKFTEKTHQYFLNYKQLTSVTTFLHKFEPKFEEEKYSLKKAEQLGMTQNEIKAMWKADNLKSIVKGSIIHNYIEQLFHNKLYEYPEKYVLDQLGSDPIRDEFNIIKNHVDKFYQSTINKLIPIRLEFIVYDKELGLAGTMDGLFYNLKAKEFQIYDWKSNKKFRNKSQFKQTFKSPISHIDSCEYELYSFQVSLYKYILQRRTGINIGKCYVVWFHEKNDNFQIFEAIDRTGLLPLLFF